MHAVNPLCAVCHRLQGGGRGVPTITFTTRNLIFSNEKSWAVKSNNYLLTPKYEYLPHYLQVIQANE